MKKTVLLLSVAVLFGLTAFAQKDAKKSSNTPIKTATPASPASPTSPVPAVPQNNANANADANMKFEVEEHDFGTIPEGPAVTYDFVFKNIGKEPIVLSGVQASCGCTTPTWTKEPVNPGKTGKISATYNTQGRPGNFIKTITITSNVGSKVVKIKGIVEKAPESSVPANNNSMMKH